MIQLYINWSHDETEPQKPKAEIHPDRAFNGSLTDITNVQVAYGSGPITVIFHIESTAGLAMGDILARLGQAGCILGSFTDSHTGATWYG